MKKILFLIAFVILSLLNGCKHATEPQKPDIYVNYEIESAFQDDSVKLTLDDKVLVDSRVTTNLTINLAWSSGLQKLTRSNHTLHFSVPDYRVQRDYTIDTANDTSTVVLRFDKSTNQINIEQVKGMLLRL